MDKLLDFLLWINGVFSRTRDPVLAKHRNLQRHWVLSASTAIFALAAEYVFASLVPAENLYRPIVQAAIAPFSWLFGAVAVISLFWLTWATYALWQFEHDD